MCVDGVVCLFLKLVFLSCYRLFCLTKYCSKHLLLIITKYHQFNSKSSYHQLSLLTEITKTRRSPSRPKITPAKVPRGLWPGWADDAPTFLDDAVNTKE
jgi:hypothetical protein